MARPARLVHAVGAALLVAASATLAVGASPAAPAWGASPCTAPDVRLAVDFRHWPGGFNGNGSAGNLVTACVTYSGGMTGADLFGDAGFTLAGTAHDGPAFICRINGLPAATGNPAPRTDEPCAATPPAGAYWSYWYAKPGDTTWTYSSLGAYSHTVNAGSVEAWTYGATDVGGTTGQPSFSPGSLMPAVGDGTTGSGGGSGSGSGSGSGNGSGGGSGGGSGSGGGAGGSPAGGASAPAGGSSSGGGTPASGHAKADATNSGPATAPGSSPNPSSRPTAAGAATSSAATSSSGAASTGSTPSSVDIGAIARPAGSSSSGTPWATLATVGALAVAALVGGGVVWRRKRESS